MSAPTAAMPIDPAARCCIDAAVDTGRLRSRAAAAVLRDAALRARHRDADRVMPEDTRAALTARRLPPEEARRLLAPEPIPPRATIEVGDRVAASVDGAAGPWKVTDVVSLEKPYVVRAHRRGARADVRTLVLGDVERVETGP